MIEIFRPSLLTSRLNALMFGPSTTKGRTQMLNYDEILTAAFAAADAAIAAEVAKRPENERDFDCGFA